MLEVTGGRWLFDIAHLVARHNSSFTDRCRQAAETAVTRSKDYANSIEQGLKELLGLEDPSDLGQLQAAATAVRAVKRLQPP